MILVTGAAGFIGSNLLERLLILNQKIIGLDNFETGYQSNIDEAIKIARMGKGSLVCSIITEDMKIAEQFVLGAASMHGRILILNQRCVDESTGHGSPMPLLKHGGPGRAGGGEEMGGKRGILHYLQRTAIQGHPTTVTAITKQYQYGSEQNTSGKHIFKKHFEEIEIGDTVQYADHAMPTPMQHNGEEHLLLQLGDVYAIIRYDE